MIPQNSLSKLKLLDQFANSIEEIEHSLLHTMLARSLIDSNSYDVTHSSNNPTALY